jgi:RNA polymerase sigma-70 factor (ECF subfamily)
LRLRPGERRTAAARRLCPLFFDSQKIMKRGQKMSEFETINYLGKEIEVSREIAEFIEECRLEDRRQKEEIRRHRSDKELTDENIHKYASRLPTESEDDLIRRLLKEQLREVVKLLPEPQRRRLVAHFYGGLTYREIAEREGVGHTKIQRSINAAIKNLKNNFK